MAQNAPRDSLEAFLLDAYGPDPYGHVRTASDQHREEHGPDCGAFPSGPIKMRIIAALVRATGARRILEIGCGLGYSALWLADAAGPDARVQTIDRFRQHAEIARRFAADAGLAERVEVLEGEAIDLLPSLSGPYDLIHDDAWFAQEPPYLERAVDLLRPGGLMVMSNWFLLEESFSDAGQERWDELVGPDWADHVRAYARRLATHPRLYAAFDLPQLAVAVRSA